MWDTVERYGIYRTRLVGEDLFVTLMNNKQYDSKELAEWGLEKIIEKELKERKVSIFKNKDWTIIMPGSVTLEKFKQCLKFGCDVAEWYQVKKILKAETHVVNEKMYQQALKYLPKIGENGYIGVTTLQKYLRVGYKECDLILQRLVKERYVSEWHVLLGQRILRTK